MVSDLSWSVRLARRASVVGVSMLLAVGGLLVAAPAAPAAPAAAPGPAPAAAPAVVSGQAVSVATGLSSTCALTTAGGVKCWGSNRFGQLGDGSLVSHERPADVVGLTSGVAQISSLAYTACAVTAVGGVRCWGRGSAGLLGSGSFSDSSIPVDVVGLTSGVRSVSVGESAACAVMTAGGLTCWGPGGFGSLGNGSSDPSAVPVDVVGLDSGVRAVAVGGIHGCALTTVGVSCWGYNGNGQLGIGSRTTQLTPVAVPRLGADTATISAGPLSTCATTRSGRLLCFGDNARHWLGVESTRPWVMRPRPVTGLTRASSVSMASEVGAVTCAVAQRDAWCWGASYTGALGQGTTTSLSSPTPVAGIPGPVTAVSTSGSHTCALNRAGRVFCWGLNSSGQLGDGTTADSLTPVRVVSLGA